MEKRGFHLVGSVWQGGVVLEGDPEDDAQLESFLRNQYRTRESIYMSSNTSMVANSAMRMRLTACAFLSLFLCPIHSRFSHTKPPSGGVLCRELRGSLAAHNVGAGG